MCLTGFPGDHPPLPQVVAHGKQPKVFACGYCHLPNGQGRPENASLAGQPAPYIIEQVMEMKAGRRKTSSPTMGSIKAMYQIADAVSPEDLKVAADYFSKLKYKKWIKVVETDTVPKFEISSHNMLVKASGSGKEPIGNRIVEMPRIWTWSNCAIQIPVLSPMCPRARSSAGESWWKAAMGRSPARLAMAQP